MPAPVLSWLFTAQRCPEPFLVDQFSPCAGPPPTKRHVGSLCATQPSEYPPLSPSPSPSLSLSLQSYGSTVPTSLTYFVLCAKTRVGATTGHTVVLCGPGHTTAPGTTNQARTKLRLKEIPQPDTTTVAAVAAAPPAPPHNLHAARHTPHTPHLPPRPQPHPTLSPPPYTSPPPPPRLFLLLQATLSTLFLQPSHAVPPSHTTLHRR